MKVAEIKYNEGLKKAYELSEGNKRKDSYVIFKDGLDKRDTIALFDNPTPSEVFFRENHGMPSRRRGKTVLYLKSVFTDENGNPLPHNESRLVLMKHKMYSRKDVEVKNVNFDVVGVVLSSPSIRGGVLVNKISYK